MFNFKTIKDIDVKGKRALVRVDYNVPVSDDGNIQDTTRIDASLDTIKYLRDHGAITILLSHRGRPKAQHKAELSLNIVARYLEKKLETPIHFFNKRPPALKNGDIALMENIRFEEGEEKNDPLFAKEISLLGDFFVQDAFATAHRAHASTVGIARYIPAVSGLLMEKELTNLKTILEAPEHPLTALVGGAKIASKIDLLKNLVKKTDNLVLGGGMANTFLFATGHDMKASLFETEMKETALEIIKEAKENNCEIILPKDVVASKEFKANAEHVTRDSDALQTGEMALDIGIKSIEEIKNTLKNSKSVVWNGPLGAFELEPFDHATNELATFVANGTKKGLFKSIAGGGDTVSALNKADAAKDFSYISTGGGAFLEWLEGKILPGIEILSQ